MSYNLLEENWIPVLYQDGRACRVGIKRALAEAGQIRALAAANPMDNVALLRFLLAVLLWCKPENVSRDEFINACRNGIPSEFLAKLEQYRECFDLLGSKHRFYQDREVRNDGFKHNVNRLFPYLPSGTEIAHFRHTADESARLCAACCALGLVRLPACATQGGRSLRPSINNRPPIYFVPSGNSLLEALVKSCPDEEAVCEDDRPAWDPSPGKTSGEAIGLLEGLTWQPRAAWLGPAVEDSHGRCPLCGSPGPLFSRLAFTFKRGEKPPGNARRWRDPHAASPSAGQSGNQNELLRCPLDPIKHPDQEAALWRESVRAILESAVRDKSWIVPALARAFEQQSSSARVRVASFEPFTKQAKTYDETSSIWTIPQDRERVKIALDALDFLQELDLEKIVERALAREGPAGAKPQAEGRLAIKAALANIAAHLERTLRRRFEQLLRDLAEAKTEPEQEHSVNKWVDKWRDEIQKTLAQQLDEACRTLVPDSPLRRLEASRRARDELMGRFGSGRKKPSTARAASAPSEVSHER